MSQTKEKPKQLFKDFIGKHVFLTNWSGALYHGVLYYKGLRVALQRPAFFQKQHGVWQTSKANKTRFFNQDRIQVSTGDIS